MLKKFKQKKDGFTLVELIAVIAVIAILAAVMMPKFNGFRRSAYRSNALNVAKHVQLSVEAFHAENEKYPTPKQIRSYSDDLPANPELRIGDVALADKAPLGKGDFKIQLKAKDDKWYEVKYDASEGSFEKTQEGIPASDAKLITESTKASN